VRIETRGVHVGRYRRAGADSLTLDESDGPRPVALRDIRTIARAVPQYGKGAAMGATTGGALFGLLGLTLGNAFCDAADCRQERVSAVVASTVAGAAIGGLVGLGIGAFTHGWKRVYPQ
jgi:hypothetical protein